MPLGDGAVNEILPFAPDASEAAGELEPLESYATHSLRLRGHQPGLARLEIQNRANRQAAHVASGVAQFIANRFPPGVLDDGDLDLIEAGLVTAVREAALSGMFEIVDGCLAIRLELPGGGGGPVV